MLQKPRILTKKTLGDRAFLAAVPTKYEMSPIFIGLKVYLILDKLFIRIF